MSLPILELTTLMQLTSALPLAEGATETLDIVTIIKGGGPVMYPLIAVSVLTVIMVILYLFTITRKAIVTRKYMEAAENMLRHLDLRSLQTYSVKRNEMVARVMEQMLHFIGESPDADYNEVREVGEAEGARQAGILTQRVSYLADIGAIAPMIGLLGTVIGMIKAFMDISKDQAGVKHMTLAGGVSEALFTTAAGLIVGIVAMIFYSIFRGRVRRYLAEMESATTHLLALIGPILRKKQEPSAPKQ